MITEKDLLEAISECHGERNPNANTCIKLAAYYTILNELTGEPKIVQSYATGYESETEFGQAIAGRDMDEVMPVIDELMTALSVLQPRLYRGVMRKLER